MSKILENRLERIQLAIEKGFTGNPETGEVFGIRGGLVTNKNKDGYIIITFKYKTKLKYVRAHQFIYYLSHGTVVEQIDHINCVRDDNRISNLRSITNQENAFNAHKAKGCFWCKREKKWQAKINVDGKQIYLGYFLEEADARQAYLDAKEKYHIINN